MGKLKSKGKKGMAGILATALMISMVSGVPGTVNEVQAADDTVNELSVTAYATKEQLMSSFDLDGSTDDAGVTNDVVGRIIFGKDSKGKQQEWYIAGKDNEIKTKDGAVIDNMILFAASPLVTRKKFSSSSDEKTDASLWADCTYPKDKTISKVYSNHYGASELRLTLQEMLKDSDGNIVTQYFSKAEQNLMNETTVTTYDKCNEVSYTTTDKLYALKGDYNNDEQLCAGSADSTVIALEHWGDSEEAYWFWLRSPYDTNATLALSANPSYYVDIGNVFLSYAVQPAFNLNLSSVLFASGAPVASSSSDAIDTIAAKTAMILRWDGSGKKIGNAVYDLDANTIIAQKDTNAEGTVTLIVQGKGENNDWYYSTEVTGTSTVTGEDIKTALESKSIPVSNISFADCKIWIEITMDNVTYANEAKELEKSVVSGVVVAPAVDVATGIYTENKRITLSTSTEGAEIYYTLDGSTPSKTNGTKYTGAISVTGTAGESVTTTIKAIAVKKGMYDSEVKTFKYVINLPKVFAKGTEIKDADNKAIYKVTESGTTNATVEYVAPTSKTAKTVTIPETITVDGVTYKVTSISKNAFKKNTKIITIKIGNNVITIGANAFYGCTNLRTVSIGKNVKNIGSNAFSGCKRLKKVNMGNNVITIGNRAFYKCTALTKITIPAKVNKIGKQAFYGCKKLKNINIKTKKLTKKKVGSKAFGKTYAKAKVKVPKSKLKSYKKFLYKKGLNKKAKINRM